MAEKVAEFRLIDYKIFKSIIDIKELSKKKSKLSVNFSSKAEETPDKNEFKLEIDTKITNDIKTLSINVITVGLFEFNPNLKDKERFFNVNAPAILFPYIRAYISALTALSGIPPIILPTLNLAARSKPKDNK